MGSSPSFLVLAVFATAAYLIGGLPFGYWFVRLTAGQDIRTMGSGNIGATNVHRTFGRKAGIVVLLLDVAKGWIAVFLAGAGTHGNPLAVALAIAAVMLGHCYPVFLNFKGGKAVACFIGAFLYAAPLALLAVLAFFVLVVALSRYISLGSVLATVALPSIAHALGAPAPTLVIAWSAAALIIFRHRGNLKRLIGGTERRIGVRA